MKYIICLIGIITSIQASQEKHSDFYPYHIEKYNAFLAIATPQKKKTDWKDVKALCDDIFEKNRLATTAPEKSVKAYWKFMMRCSVDADYMTSQQKAVLFRYSPIIPIEQTKLLKIMHKVNQELMEAVNNNECGGFEWKKCFVEPQELQEPAPDILRAERLKVLTDFQEMLDKDSAQISQER